MTKQFGDNTRGPEFCSDALNYYSSTYTWMLISQLLGPLVFGILIPIIGTAPTRIIGSVEPKVGYTARTMGPDIGQVKYVLVRRILVSSVKASCMYSTGVILLTFYKGPG